MLTRGVWEPSESLSESSPGPRLLRFCGVVVVPLLSPSMLGPTVCTGPKPRLVKKLELMDVYLVIRRRYHVSLSHLSKPQ